MIGTILTILGCLAAATASFWWWRSYLNPVTLGVLAWTPGLVMMNWPQFFLSPLYIHQNRPFSMLVIYAMAMGFLSFWAGCAVAKAMSPRDAFVLDAERLRLRVDTRRLAIVFAIGLGVFLYAFLNSGLTDLAYMDEQQVAESRLALHLGWISFLEILMDIGAIGFFARFLQTGRWINVVPLVIALLAYGATLQKSLIVWVVSAAIFVAALHPRAVHRLLLRRPDTRLAVLAFAVAVVAGLAVTNRARGISEIPLTASPFKLVEQLYIYSGATAIKNLSVTLEGYLPTDGPTFGAYLIRPVLWQFVDRDLFASGRYFEGVNAATYLNNAWIDFRWAGFVITPFLTGVMVMLFIRLALSGTLFGLIAGAIAARAVIFTIGTDVTFEPITWYTLGLALVADLATRARGVRLPPGQLPGIPRQQPLASLPPPPFMRPPPRPREPFGA